MDLLNSQHKV